MVSKQEQLDMDLMAEAELTRLQRQYRIMEGDRRAFFDETSNKLAKQRKEIDRLKREKNELMTNIKVATCQEQKRKDFKMTKTFLKLLKDYDDVIERLKEERVKLEEIEQQIKKTEREVSALRTNDITDHEYQTRQKSGQMSVKILESRLEITIKRFCAILAANKSLRHEIDHLLKERTSFNTIWEQLLTDLSNGKKLLLDLIEQATLAYDQREEWCSKLQALKIRAHNDVIAHTQEMREMQRQLDHDGGLKEFLTIKGQRRIMRDLEEKEMKKKEEERLQLEEQLKRFQETLEEIKTIAKEEDVEKLGPAYLKQDEENFALFNYVNELSIELENLHNSVDTLDEKIEEQKWKSEERQRNEQSNFGDLRSKIQNVKRQADEDEDELKQLQAELKKVLKAIYGIFVVVGCENTPILGLISDNNDLVNDDNVMVYLGLIQKKVSGLITDVYFKEKSLMKPKKGRKDNQN